MKCPWPEKDCTCTYSTWQTQHMEGEGFGLVLANGELPVGPAADTDYVTRDGTVVNLKTHWWNQYTHGWVKR